MTNTTWAPREVRSAGVAALAAIVTVVAAATTHAADATFVVQPPLTHTLTARSALSVPILLSSSSTLTGVNVVVLQIKSPRGELLGNDTLVVEGVPSELGPAGAQMALKITDRTRFRITGDYVATLRATGTVNQQVQAQLLTLTLNVPEPVLNLTKFQNAVIRVERWTPWTTTDADAVLKVEESGGRSDVSELTVSAQNVYLKGTTELAEGRLEVVDGPNAAKTLPAGEQREIHVRATGFTRAGTWNSGLTAVSPTIATPVNIPLTIEVSDRWPIPVLVIALGVILGAFVRTLSQVTRPRETLRLRASNLAADVARWRERSRDPLQMQALRAIDDRLRQAEGRLEDKDVASAGTLLDKAATDTDAFRIAWEQRFAAAAAAVTAALAALNGIRGHVDTSDADQVGALEKADGAIAAGQRALREFDVSGAEAAIESAKAATAALKTRVTPVGRGLAPGRRQATIRLSVDGGDAAQAAGTEVGLSVDDPDGAFQAGDRFEWDFGDGGRDTTTRPNATHRFGTAGSHNVTVRVMRAGAAVMSHTAAVAVMPRPIETVVIQQRRTLASIDRSLTAVSLVLAVVTCLSVVFVGKSFGTPQQYIEAFLWGFGIDSGVKNIADLLKKI